MIGRGANFHSMTMNATSATTPNTRRVMTSADDHGNDDPPREMGTRIKIVATRLVNEPRKSTFFNFDLKEPETGFRGRKKVI